MGYGEESTEQRRSHTPIGATAGPAWLAAPTKSSTTLLVMLCSSPPVLPGPWEGPPAQCPMSATEGTHPVGASLALGGQVGSRASDARFPPIFIFHVAKPWEELGSGSHVQQERQSRVPGDCWVQQGEGLINKTLLVLTCGFFYSLPGKCRTGEKLAVPRATCSGVIPDWSLGEPWGHHSRGWWPANLSPLTWDCPLSSLEGHQQSCCVPWQPRLGSQGHMKPKNPPAIPVSLLPHTSGLCFLG